MSEEHRDLTVEEFAAMGASAEQVAQYAALVARLAELTAAAGRDPNTGRFLPGHEQWAYIRPERLARGDRNGQRIHPERTARGDEHYSRRHPERLARGQRHGSRTHPERVPRGERNWSAKLTEESVREIRRAYACGESAASLAQRYRVAEATLRQAATRWTWKHVE